MSKILKWGFGVIAAWEAVLLLADFGGPEDMATEMLSFEEVRMGILLASLFCLTFLEIMDGADAKG